MASAHPTMPIAVEVESYKISHGASKNLDVKFDMCELPDPQTKCAAVVANPELTGQDPVVQNFLDSGGKLSAAVNNMVPLLYAMFPQLLSKTGTQIRIGIACTGGRHRSVATVEFLAKKLREQMGSEVSVTHRELVSAESSATELPESAPSSGSAKPPTMYRYNVTSGTFDSIESSTLSDETVGNLLKNGLDVLGELREKRRKLVHSGGASATRPSTENL